MPKTLSFLKEKVAGIDLQTLFLAGVSKYGTEQLISMTPVGNANFVSGAAKVGGAMLISGFSTKWYARAVALGMGVDGVEDILNQLMTQFGVTAGVGGVSVI